MFLMVQRYRFLDNYTTIIRDKIKKKMAQIQF